MREVRIYTRAMDWKGMASGRSKVIVYSTIQSHQHFIGAKQKHYSTAIWTPVYISENLFVYEFWFWESVREVRIYTWAMDWKGMASGRSKVLVYSTIQSHQHFIGAKQKHYSIAIWTPIYISENLCV